MTASPSDIARFTNDGVVITKSNAVVHLQDLNALDDAEELELFFDAAADADAMLTIRFAILSAMGRWHEMVEIEDTLGLGTTIALAPALPQFLIIDDSRNINGRAAVRSLSFDLTIDRYAVELVGTAL